jgi:hypothetical protein
MFRRLNWARHSLVDDPLEHLRLEFFKVSGSEILLTLLLSYSGSHWYEVRDVGACPLRPLYSADLQTAIVHINGGQGCGGYTSMALGATDP